MAHDVFISYSSYDKQIANAICSKLENSNIRCWVAPRDIIPGKEYGEAIIEGLESCSILLLVFSIHANESPQVRREVERAVSKGKIIIPFRIEDNLPTKAMEFALSNTHWLDAMTPPLESHIARLTDTIFKLIKIPTENRKPHPEPPTPIVGLHIKDSFGNETTLTEYGVVYNLYAEKVLSNSVRTHLIIEKGSVTQEIPWAQIEKVDIPNIERAKITLVDSITLDPVKLRTGRLVGKDESGFAVVLDLANIRSINPHRGKVVIKETTTISRTESLSNKTNLNLAPGNLPDSKTQLSWKMKTTTGPGKRSDFGMVYDDKIEGIILQGGFGSGNDDDRPFSQQRRSPDLFDTCIWDGKSWQVIEKNPLTLQSHTLAYNKSTKQCIIYGGNIGGSFHIPNTDTYLMNDENWIKVDFNCEQGPKKRSKHAMSFDGIRETIILFGGYTIAPGVHSTLKSTIVSSETWEFDGYVWEKFHVNSPEPRCGHQMVYDEGNGVIVLFGGYNDSNYFDDTWIWEGNTATWSKITTENIPSVRCNHAMTYDRVSKKVLLFGGQSDSKVPLNDLWEWDGNDWKLLTEHALPKPRYNHGFVYDEKRNKSILFGGYDGKEWFQDTWEFTYR